jgi:drug/metabolite transporter (DMT)-like permease
MFPLLLLIRRKTHPDFRNRRFLQHLIIVTLTAGIGYHLFFFMALNYTNPTNTALIIALNPFFTAVAEIFVFRKRRPVRFYIGFMLAFGGAIWVNISRNGSADFSNLGRGEAYCLLAAVLWSVYTILSKVTKDEHWDSLWINAYNYLFTGLLMIPFLQSLAWPAISLTAWTAIFYMGIFPTAIGYTLFYVGVQKRGPAWATTFIYLVPSVTFILDHLFFDAGLSLAMVLGTTAVVLGLLIGNVQIKGLRPGSSVDRLNEHKNAAEKR